MLLTKQIRATLVVVILAIAVMAVSAATAATFVSADDNNCQSAGGVTTCTSDQHFSFSSVSYTDQETAVVNLNSNGKIQVAYTMPNGLPKSMQTNCVVAATDNKKGHIKIGTSYTNSGTLRTTGRFGMFTDYVRAGDKFCLAGGVWRKVRCGNHVWLHMRPPGQILPFAKVEVVQYFTYTVTVTMKANLNGVVDAMATCTGNGVSATASIHGTGSVYILVKATASAKSRIAAKGLATGRAKITENQHQDLVIKAQKAATLDLTGSARAICVGTVQPAPKEQPAHANVVKTAFLNGGSVALTGGEFTFDIYVNGLKMGSVTNGPTAQSKDVGVTFLAGQNVHLCEVAPSGNWTGYTPAQQCTPDHTMAAGETFTFFFVNSKTSTTPPPPPATHNCAVSPILEKDGRLVRLLIGTDTNGPVTTVNWGDGTTQSNVGLQPSYTYGSDGTWNISVSIRYNDGNTSSCNTSVTTKLVTQPPPPPIAPGPNPPNTTGGAGGTTTGNGGTNGGGLAPCPPGWKSDGHGGCIPQ